MLKMPSEFGVGRAALLLLWLLAGCEYHYTQLFEPFPTAEAARTRGCQLEEHSFALEIQCFRLATGDLKKLLFIDDLDPKARVRLFPVTAGREELFAVKELATPSKTNESGLAYQWLGSVYSIMQPQTKIGTALFSVSEGSIVGRITAGSDIFEIRPLDGDVHVSITLDPSKSPPLHRPERLERPKAGLREDPIYTADRAVGTINESRGQTVTAAQLREHANGRPAAANAADDCTPIGRSNGSRDAKPVVTIAVAFEKSAVPSDRAIARLGRAYIAFTDIALKASKSDLSVALPNSTEAIQVFDDFVVSDDVPDNDAKTFKMLAAGNSQSNGIVGSVLQWRDRIRADLVVIITKRIPNCGVSSMVTADGPQHGFALVRPDCGFVRLQVAHEVGHLLGGDHNTGALVSPRSCPYARGFVLENQKKQTIMVQGNMTTEPYFSNPDVSWAPNIPMGSREANNSRALRARGPVVSQFFP